MLSRRRWSSRGRGSSRTLGARRQRQTRRAMEVETLEARTVMSASSFDSPSQSARDYPQLVVDRSDYDAASILVRFQPGAADKSAESILPGAKNGKHFSTVP